MDKDTLALRVRERADSVGIKPVQLAKAIHRGRDYVTDLLNGRKASIPNDILTPLATALECDERYFTDINFASPGRPRRQASVDDLARHTEAARAGFFIKAWREFKRLAETDLVDETGWSIATVVDLDEGNRAATDSEASELARIFGTTAGSLRSNPFETDRRVARLASISEGLDADDQRTLIEMAEAFERRRTGTFG